MQPAIVQEKKKPVRVQFNAPSHPLNPQFTDLLSRQLQTFLNSNTHYEIVAFNPMLSPTEKLEKRLNTAAGYQGVDSLKLRAGAFVLAGLAADALADVSVRLIFGESTVRQEIEDYPLWDTPLAAVAVLGARLSGCQKHVVLYPSVYTMGRLDKKNGFGPGQQEEMAAAVIKSVVQRWRLDYVRNALQLKKAA